jgi:hypothetical protein
MVDQGGLMVTPGSYHSPDISERSGRHVPWSTVWDTSFFSAHAFTNDANFDRQVGNINL